MIAQEISYIRACVQESFAYPNIGGKGYLTDHFLVDLPIYRNIIIANELAVKLPQKAKVLDFGCGYGDMAYLLKNRRPNLDIQGLDILTSEPWQVLTKKINVKTTTAPDESHIPFESGSFDSIVAIGSLEHVQNEDQSLNELHRIVKPGGSLNIFLYPNKYSYTEWFQGFIGHPSHERKKTLAELARLLEQHGFTVVTRKRQFFLPFTLSRFSPKMRRFYNYFAKPICFINRILEKIPGLNIFCATLAIETKKTR